MRKYRTLKTMLSQTPRVKVGGMKGKLAFQQAIVRMNVLARRGWTENLIFKMEGIA